LCRNRISPDAGQRNKAGFKNTLKQLQLSG